ncbi:hypothetical protein [Streptomyces soliscabiei]|uniref:hypothetical protein n=1 Tax=Streptomyces soliscabiei TaxID=588897 RepID=UPI0029A700F6|nr:hypothetical protein [Streptomyces sp. NY05-11A]MDX2680464.1 hypothetical protein [Streptomyces sp. NY05-11A]
MTSARLVRGPDVTVAPGAWVGHDNWDISAACPTGYRSSGGGHGSDSATADPQYVVTRFDRWAVGIRNTGTNPVTVRAFAVCIPSA